MTNLEDAICDVELNCVIQWGASVNLHILADKWGGQTRKTFEYNTIQLHKLHCPYDHKTLI